MGGEGRNFYETRELNMLCMMKDCEFIDLGAINRSVRIAHAAYDEGMWERRNNEKNDYIKSFG